MSGEIVGYATRPREGRPSRYCGRTMRYPIGGAKFIDEGLGNPFTAKNSDDPVRDYDRLLRGERVALEHANWTIPRLLALLDRLPTLIVGQDLLCWCYKGEPFVPDDSNRAEWTCHACTLLVWGREWEQRHPAWAAAIRRELPWGVTA